jgi:hypothetical protein
LRPAARLVLAVFLALDDAAVAGEEPLGFGQRAQSRLVAHQRLADTVPCRSDDGTVTAGGQLTKRRAPQGLIFADRCEPVHISCSESAPD